MTIRNLRAGRGSIDLNVRDGTVEVLANTSAFEVIHGPAPRPGAPEEPRHTARTATRTKRNSRTAAPAEATRRSP